MTAREQRMHLLLPAALPECTVLAQVAFSAGDSEGWADSNRFDRKVAAFVLCSQQLHVIAVIELDDSSHAGRDRQHKKRDAMLKLAAYAALRYAPLPTQPALRATIGQLLTQQTVALPV